MNFRILIFLTALSAASPAAAERPTVEEVQIAVEKGLFFVEKTSMEWWKSKKCSSCHNGPMLMFSHNIAKRQGFPVDQKKLDFWMDVWIIPDRLNREPRKKDGRLDAGGMVGVPHNFYFRDQGGDHLKERSENLGKLAQIAWNDWQLEDGSWDTSVRYDYRPWIALALGSFADLALSVEMQAEVAKRAERTERVIREGEPVTPEITEDLASWLVYEHRRGNAERVAVLLEELKTRRRDDGLWGITAEAEHGHQLVTGAVLFALTSIGKDTSDPLVAETQQLLIGVQKEDGRWEEGGRIFDDGAEIENVVYNNWATGMITAALAQTIELPEGAERRFFPDPDEVQNVDAIAAEAAKHDYKTKPTEDGVGAN